MKRLHFNRPNDLSRLLDELLAAMPTLRQVRVGADGFNEALFDNLRVEGKDNDMWLTVPDDADELAIGAVVLAHDPSLPYFDPAARRRDRVMELLAIGRSNWIVSQRNELLELLGQQVTR